MYRNTNGTVVSRVTCRVNSSKNSKKWILKLKGYRFSSYGPDILAIPILVVELYDIVESWIIVNYTEKVLIRACRS